MGITVPENNKTITIPIGQLGVDGERRPINEAKVAELMESIRSVGNLNPIIVVVQKPEGGEENVRLVAGLHRLEAMKRLGITNIQCTVLDVHGVLRIKLAEIDENIIRNNPTPAEHAILTQRRADIIQELARLHGTLSQNATASKQALRRAGQRPGHDAASVRDQAKKTGQSKDKVQRSKKRSGILGGLLNKVVGTSLDKGTELDALLNLPVAQREALANRAASGEVVSARTTDRKPRPKPDHKPKLTRLQKADAELDAWCEKYKDLKVIEEMGPHLMDIGYHFAAAIEEEGRLASTVAETDTRESR
jgi:ParB/RepB/Spo0J family partition protein